MIKIKNWSTYQSYKDRKPPWIRFHRTMIDNFEYQSMSAESRALLPMLWLLACEDEDPKSGLIRLKIDKIAFRLRRTEKEIAASIKELQAVDFIECIETVTKSYNHSSIPVTPETETETETETDKCFSFKRELLSLGVNRNYLDDWMKVRRLKRAANTKSALTLFINSVGKSKYSVPDAVKICAERSWSGFNANWLNGADGSYQVSTEKSLVQIAEEMEDL